MTEENHTSSRAWKKALLVVVVVLVALALRSHRIRFVDPWEDEIFTVVVSSSSPAAVLDDARQNEHPALPTLFTHCWFQVFGSSIESARAPSVIFSILSIFLIARLGRRLISREAGWIAAAFMLFSAFQTHYAQEARIYALFLLVSLVSADLFITVQSKPRWRSLALYAVSLSVLYWCHYYGLFVVAAHFLAWFLCVRWRQSWLLLVTVHGAAALMALPVLLQLIERALYRMNVGFWIPKPVLKDLSKTIGAYLAGWQGMQFMVQFGVYVLGALALILAALLFSGIRSRIGRRLEMVPSSNVQPVPFFTLLIVLTVLVPFAASYIIQPFHRIRYTMPASAMVYLLLAFGIVHIRWWAVRGLIVLALVLPSIPGSMKKTPWSGILDWTGTVETIQAYKEERPRIYCASAGIYVYTYLLPRSERIGLAAASPWPSDYLHVRLLPRPESNKDLEGFVQAFLQEARTQREPFWIALQSGREKSGRRYLDQVKKRLKGWTVAYEGVYGEMIEYDAIHLLRFEPTGPAQGSDP